MKLYRILTYLSYSKNRIRIISEKFGWKFQKYFKIVKMYKIYCKICRGKTQFWVKTPILHTNTESLVSTPRRKIKNEKFNQVYAS